MNAPTPPQCAHPDRCRLKLSPSQPQGDFWSCSFDDCHHRIYGVAGPGWKPSSMDPRDPDPTREGVFRNHNCGGCNSGERPCREGNSNSCSWPRARND